MVTACVSQWDNLPLSQTTITSIQNPRVRWLGLLQSQPRLRRKERAFIVEGVRLAEEALASGWKARLILYTDQLSERGRFVLDGFTAQGALAEQVSEAVMRHVSDTQTPQGLLLALEWLPVPLPPQPRFVFIPDQMRDPGNLGTILRTAEAASIDAVLLPPGTVDAFSPKIIRAGMGAHFRLPIHEMAWERIAIYLKGLQIFLAAAGQGKSFTKVNLSHPLALIVGGEAEGASVEAARLATTAIHIPMPGKSESLNAAVAAAILMFEVVRQKKA